MYSPFMLWQSQITDKFASGSWNFWQLPDEIGRTKGSAQKKQLLLIALVVIRFLWLPVAFMEDRD